MAKVPDFVLEMLMSDPLMRGRELRTEGSSLYVGLPEEDLSEEGTPRDTVKQADEQELWNLRQAVALLMSMYKLSPTEARRSYIAEADVGSLRALCAYLGEHRSWPEEWSPSE